MSPKMEKKRWICSEKKCPSISTLSTVVVVAVAGPSPGILLFVLTASAMLNAELATH
tara:strand:- start:5 stop:175 length:171 start_codon:yes stop_codon:yes gene_type:complete